MIPIEPLKTEARGTLALIRFADRPLSKDRTAPHWPSLIMPTQRVFPPIFPLQVRQRDANVDNGFVQRDQGLE